MPGTAARAVEGAPVHPGKARAAGIPAMSLQVEGSRYFAIHHTEADTVDKIDPTDLATGVAAVAVMTYLIADMPLRVGQ